MTSCVSSSRDAFEINRQLSEIKYSEKIQSGTLTSRRRDMETPLNDSLIAKTPIISILSEKSRIELNDL